VINVIVIIGYVVVTLQLVMTQNVKRTTDEYTLLQGT
jgi:hypothetical protein